MLLGQDRSREAICRHSMHSFLLEAVESETNDPINFGFSKFHHRLRVKHEQIALTSTLKTIPYNSQQNTTTTTTTTTTIIIIASGQIWYKNGLPRRMSMPAPNSCRVRFNVVLAQVIEKRRLACVNEFV